VAARKADAPRIRAHLDRLRARYERDPRRHTWPTSVFHVSDLKNAISILKTGELCSRKRAGDLAFLRTDAASRSIIDQSTYAHTYARFYFRPCTPTQHNMEGIRPVADRVRGAHCPVPVFFVFDAEELLTRHDARYTDGNFAASRSSVGDDAGFLASIPWDDVYHDEPLPSDPSRRQDVIHHRQAELLVPDSVDLESLREIVCRSGPERDTLLHVLGKPLRDKWESHVRIVRRGERLFFGDWAYVESVGLLEDGAVQIKASSLKPRTYAVRVIVWYGSHQTDPEYNITHSSISLVSPIRVPLMKPPASVLVQCKIEGCTGFLAPVTRRRVFG